MAEEIEKTGWYEKAVEGVTRRVKPYLHVVTERFVKKSVHTYAEDNPRFARMIEFEVKRRGDGPGITQDVAEPLIWIGVKAAMALAIEAIMSPFKKGEGLKWKWIGHATTIGIIAQQTVELFRVLPRYRAGLQGSLEMAKDRWKSIEETGIDPFSSQTRQINKTPEVTQQLEAEAEKNFAQTVQNRSITPTAIMENKASSAELNRS